MPETPSIELLEHRIDLLSQALLKVLQTEGMIRQDIEELTGPELLHMADSYCIAMKESRTGGIMLEPGAAIQREDGRFYVPLSRIPPRADVSNIVARVASDAFEDPAIEAQLFALELAGRWNKGA
ncbi:hypothetical protein HOU00_gp301 [Caulobacter phage CcrPW]|uniref:Uncharacterized protein n=1 Tax=Caulobacter phage CcrPW TaxID=2283271 RepID=A0A385EAE0_9CAUD|nr:hypothetical protein HOU00_gp301 [Caulobacter phage CcrPW]AXQ68824.1 hypothetical protein CcrPW_gp285 [Caulobacter phage CcrPW]